jgi:hypothetical protein
VARPIDRIETLLNGLSAHEVGSGATMIDDASLILMLAALACLVPAMRAKQHDPPRPWSGALTAYGQGLLTAGLMTIALSRIEEHQVLWTGITSMAAFAGFVASVWNIIRNPNYPLRRQRTPPPRS